MKAVIFLITLFVGQYAQYTVAAVSLHEEKPLRIFHFVLRDVHLEQAQRLLIKAKEAGFNAVQVVITDGVQLEHAPWTPKEYSWTKKQFINWLSTARSQGLQVIPEIKLLTHQQLFFQNNFPDLMVNRSTYDPENEKTYQLVFPLIDEIIDLIQPKNIHIGHDEVTGYIRRRNIQPDKRVGLADDEVMLPAPLFLKDVLKLYNYLNNKGIKTWMWGDMLISPDEFPGMLDIDLHGTVKGYGNELRHQLPRDIVICDWHYLDEQTIFPSLNTFKQEGFKVLGVTWKKEKTTRNFSGYAAKNGASGMIATTWFHVQRKEWDLVDEIIKTSGEIFSKEFPDAK